jgi:Tfp pilus assembly protein PilX
MRHHTSRHKYQAGAVSLFIVIFSALLFLIITVSFVQLMVKDQQQATTSDLSQSAYDSAQAGVEDAKRVLLVNQACANGTEAVGINCASVASALSNKACNTVAAAGIAGNVNDKETLVQQADGTGKTLDQAYTCVKIDLNTNDYKGKISANQSNIVPLNATGSFNTVEVDWFSRDDISATTNNLTVGFPFSAGKVSLPQAGNQWGTTDPALMRAQFMQTGATFSLADFDGLDGSVAGSNANTLFMYPTDLNPPVQSATALDYALDPRYDSNNAPHAVACNNSFNSSVEYVCRATIKLPAPINGSAASARAFLRLSALYNGSHYSVKLFNDASLVQFANVQPMVDATGRANNMFRRVQSRVELKGDFTYPEAAVDIEGNLCKDFTITDKPDGFTDTSCTP